MYPQPPNREAEQPNCGGSADQICEVKTNLNNKANRLVEVGRECNPQIVVFAPGKLARDMKDLRENG